MKKVYCEDCKHIWRDDRSPDMCNEPHLCNWSDAEGRRVIPYCGNLNDNYDCSFYKRKWWKVWVR